MVLSVLVVFVVSVVELPMTTLEHGDVLGVLPLRAREGERDQYPEEQVGHPVKD